MNQSDNKQVPSEQEDVSSVVEPDHARLGRFLDLMDDHLVGSPFIVSTNRPDCGWVVYTGNSKLVLLENGTWTFSGPGSLSNKEVKTQ